MAIISVAYFVSQVFFWSAGGSFDSSLITFTMHLLDPELLRTRLLESLWYMHMQPPLFNLFTGIGLKLFPYAYHYFFAASFLFLGLGLSWAIYWLARSLGVSRLPALGATLLYAIGPADIFYRNWYFYSYPTMVILIALAGLLYSYLYTGKKIWGHSFFALAAVLMLTRYSYHFVWFVVLAGGLLFILKNRRRQILTMALAPALIGLFWLGKNYYLFGSFSLSTWLGWSLGKVATSFLTPEEMGDLRSAEKVSTLAGIWPGNRFEVYEDFLDETGRERHPVPALNQRYRSTTAIHDFDVRNYNNIDYIAISRQYARDALAVVRYRPRAYLRGVKRSAMMFFMPVRLFDGWEQVGLLSGYHRVWTFLGGGIHSPVITDPDILRDLAIASFQICWLVALFYILAPVIFLRDLIRGKGLARLGSARLITLGFLVFNMTYVTATGILLDYGENNRFRSEIVPLTVVVAAVIFQRFLNERKTGSAAKP